MSGSQLSSIQDNADWTVAYCGPKLVNPLVSTETSREGTNPWAKQ